MIDNFQDSLSLNDYAGGKNDMAMAKIKYLLSFPIRATHTFRIFHL